MPAEDRTRWRAFRREALVFAAFVALTVATTWPWITHLRDFVSDRGDPYFTSWVLWWDFHQTFHDPLHLFDGNIFFPYRLSLAFSEHDYGLALPMFPLFALGVRPLTVHGILTFLGFTFSGYGAFRLGRTLTGSTGAAWVAGVFFAFVPWRFGQLPHVVYLSAGWIPVLLEALVLFARQRTKKRALWLGLAFFFNGLSVIHWFILTLVPLALTAAVLAVREGAEGDRAFWRRGALAVGIAGLALLPFFLPYRAVAKEYGFERGLDEARVYSALPKDWLNADQNSHFWRAFTETPSPPERALFPGFLLLALPLAALTLSAASRARPSPSPDGSPPSPRLLAWLDGIALVAGGLALFAASPSGIHLRIAGKEVFRATEPWRALSAFALAVLVRVALAWPRWLPFVQEKSLPASLRAGQRSDVVVVGGLWAVLGFFFSLGVNSVFYRLLFETVPLFRGIRVPARAATLAYLGLAVLAGAGAAALAGAWGRRRPRAAAPRGVFVLACVLFLLENRVAPLDLVRGEADPDDATRFLAATPMKGGLVELPVNAPGHGLYQAVLRAADHRKPLITAVSGFLPATVQRIDEDTSKTPIPDDLVGYLEGIPASYVLVRDSWLSPSERPIYRAWLGRAVASGRLVFVRRFDGEVRNDLFAVAKNEPAARSLEPLPWAQPSGLTPAGAPWREDASLTGNIDDPGEGAVVKETLRVSGWARVAGEDLDVSFLVDGEVRRPESAGRTSRPDVCAALPGLSDCSRAGYEAAFAFQPHDAGAHEIVVLLRSKDGRERHFPARRFVWQGAR